MKKEILKRLLATPGAEHTVSEFDTHFTGELTTGSWGTTG